MTKFSPALALPLVAVLALTACDEVGTGTNETTGAVGGAVAGGILGGLVSGDVGGAAIGAVAGGIVGGMVGNELDKQAGELRSGFGNSNIGVVNTGTSLIVTMPQDILFATDSATLTGTLRSDLAVLARHLNKYPNSTVQVLGHTDNVGDAGYNLNLSRQRAQAVSSVLISNGVSSGRVASIGRGESQPVATNLTADGRAQNRRVEIVIIPN